MVLPDTNTLDIQSRGTAAEYVYVTTTTPTVDTTTLDYQSRGSSARYMYIATAAAGSSLIKKFIGVTQATIKKVSGVSNASIKKLAGVANT